MSKDHRTAWGEVEIMTGRRWSTGIGGRANLVAHKCQRQGQQYAKITKRGKSEEQRSFACSFYFLTP